MHCSCVNGAGPGLFWCLFLASMQYDHFRSSTRDVNGASFRHGAHFSLAEMLRRLSAVSGIITFTATRNKASCAEDELDDVIRRGGYEVHVSLPRGYHLTSHLRKDYPVLYVLDPSSQLSPHVAARARERHQTVSSQIDRQWYPDIIVVGVTGGKTPNAEDLLYYCCSSLVGVIDQRYRTKPYGTGRALCGHSWGGAVVSHALASPRCMSLFGYILIGSPNVADCVDTASVLLPLQGGLFVSVGEEGHEHQYVQQLKGALEKAGGVKQAACLVVEVDPATGEQNLKEMAKRGAALEAISLHAHKAGAGDAPTYAHLCVDWLARRLEVRKLDSLARQYNWGEFS